MRAYVAAVLLVGLALGGCKLKEDQGGAIPAPPDVAAPPADAITTPSGLASKVLQVGMSNVRASARSTVRVHYTGWTAADGKMFDSSVLRNEPIEGQVTGFIQGWQEGLQLMVVGEKRRFWIPGKLGYDFVGARADAPKGMLVFDVELLGVK